MAEENVLNSFINKKKAESQFLSLDDGESAKIKSLKDIKLITKTGFAGEEKEVLRLVLEMETPEGIREKTFDNGTKRFAEELSTKGVKIGSSFVITRTGLQTKTRYTISDVSVPTPAASTAPAPAPAATPSAPTTPSAVPIVPIK